MTSSKVDLIPKKMGKTVNRSFGYNLMSVLHVVCGQHLKIPPMDRSFGKFWRALFILHSSMIAFTAVYTFIASSIAVKSYICKEFGFAVYMAAGFLGTLECLWRIIYTTFRKRKIEFIAAKVHIALYHHNLQTDPQPFVRKLSRVLSLLIGSIFVMFALILTSGYFTIYWKLEEILENVVNNFTAAEELINNGDYPFEIIEAWTFVSQVYHLFSSMTQIKIFAGVLYFFSFFAICRIMLSDMLFYSWYSIIIHQYRQLAKILPKVMDKDSGTEGMIDWVKYHHTLNELLKEVNALTAPVITAAVVFTGLQVCIFSFTLLKLRDDLDIVYYAIFGVSSLQQLVIYCVLGQKIKDSVNDLKAEAYKGPWMENIEMKKHAALMITAASNKDECNLPGAPLFSLSLEFLASMTSGIFTYFMVLIQLHKNDKTN